MIMIMIIIIIIIIIVICYTRAFTGVYRCLQVFSRSLIDIFGVFQVKIAENR